MKPYPSGHRLSGVATTYYGALIYYTVRNRRGLERPVAYKMYRRKSSSFTIFESRSRTSSAPKTIFF